MRVVRSLRLRGAEAYSLDGVGISKLRSKRCADGYCQPSAWPGLLLLRNPGAEGTRAIRWRLSEIGALRREPAGASFGAWFSVRLGRRRRLGAGRSRRGGFRRG